jgi:putative addiction module component (TIGR02574 family)
MTLTSLCNCTHQDILMNTAVYLDLERLSMAEKRALGEALIVSAESEASSPLLSETHRAELRSRLAFHRAHPDEGGITFAQLKTKLTAPGR